LAVEGKGVTPSNKKSTIQSDKKPAVAFGRVLPANAPDLSNKNT